MSAHSHNTVLQITSTEIINQADDDLNRKAVRLSENALTVLKARYLKKNDSGAVVEKRNTVEKGNVVDIGAPRII